MFRKSLFVAAIAAAAMAFPAATASAQAGAAAKEGADKESTGKVGEKIPQFAGKIVRGEKSADFDSSKNTKTTVYVLVGVTCPATKPYAERLCALESAYAQKGIDFVYLYPNVTESTESKAKFHKEMKFTAGLFNDDGGAVAKKLAATKTGEALIVDKTGKVLYRGGIDDNLQAPAKVKKKHLAQALDEILANKPVSEPSNKDVFG